MTHEMIKRPAAEVSEAPALDVIPATIADAGDEAAHRFFEFFTANIRNPNTRTAYHRAACRFFAWCESKRLTLPKIRPPHVAAFIEELAKKKDAGGAGLSKPSIKQHLAAVRMLFDYLVVGQVVPMNPASAVRGPSYSTKKGKTAVLNEGEARQLLERIDTSSIVGLRDRALIAVMVYGFARVGAVVAMDVKDYYPQGKRWWFRLHEKGGKNHELPAHQKAKTHCP
jgi:site-specific recombinase XerD